MNIDLEEIEIPEAAPEKKEEEIEYSEIPHISQEMTIKVSKIRMERFLKRRVRRAKILEAHPELKLAYNIRPRRIYQKGRQKYTLARQRTQKGQFRKENSK